MLAYFGGLEKSGAVAADRIEVGIRVKQGQQPNRGPNFRETSSDWRFGAGVSRTS